MNHGCAGCKYRQFRNGKKRRFVCVKWKDEDGLVFESATQAYKLGCHGKYKRPIAR